MGKGKEKQATSKQIPVNQLFADCPAFLAVKDLRQQKFILEYLKDFNGTQAAIRAGYSKHTAREQATRLLSKVHIQSALGEVSGKLLQKDIATADEILQFLTLVMRGNIADVASWNEDGMSFRVSDSDELGRDITRLIRKVKVIEKTSAKGDWTECKTSIELHDPVKAAELLGKYHQIFLDKVKHEHSGTITVKVKGREE